jgi:hypothetical protein
MGACVNLGTPVTTETSVVEIPDESLPKIAKQYIAEIERNKNGGINYLSITFSLLREDAK